IVGQLAGGAAACVGTNDNGQPDFYGRFATSWDFGTTNNTRLSNWLDPQSTGATSIDILNTPDFQFLGRISIFPNPATTIINVANNNSTQLSYQLYSINGQLILGDTLPHVNNTISVEFLSEGIYFLKLEDAASNNSLVKRIVVKK
ncbi:MAG: T9SS type A sorting domain-containing protein, partial [Flavobacteriia bacterium]|nr:T9SS type A sorting domain-containing protein [Flavobacteriia bacterium]